MKDALSVLCLVLLVSVSEAAVTKPGIGEFLGCLRSWPSPESPITDDIFTADNTTTFLSSYLSYTKNTSFLQFAFFKASCFAPAPIGFRKVIKSSVTFWFVTEPMIRAKEWSRLNIKSTGSSKKLKALGIDDIVGSDFIDKQPSRGGRHCKSIGGVALAWRLDR
ncbi:hypothetical protein F2Q68_00005594 [Brassica cretica]|uniref:Uncharacterized protein n=1 Tax=Brassica cretica TaxID=69181 RepID=A0A8S9JD33_BRACR|nr:hypothetical protein F2Q68_00005594 [Brassica cretica]